MHCDDVDQTMLGEVMATITDVHTLQNVIGTEDIMQCMLNKMHMFISEI